MIQRILEEFFTGIIEDEADLNAAMSYIVSYGDKHKFIRTNHCPQYSNAEDLCLDD